MENKTESEAYKRADPAMFILAIVTVLSCILMLSPTPAGLSRAGQKVLGIAIIAIGLWSTEMLPIGVTGILAIIALMVSGGVPSYQEALIGFAKPVAYFLIAVLTIGLAVQKSGLAERIARFFLRHSRARPFALFTHLLAALPLLTLLLPSATTRSGILVHVYEQVLILSKVPPKAPLSKAIMMALNSINRLASTAILTGGITPMVAAALVGGMPWSRWLALMLVPYLVLLVLGATLIYGIYHRGFKQKMEAVPVVNPKPFSKMETRTIVVTLGASVLWLTDAFHHLDPSLPALLAWACLLTPKIGVLTWKEFERHIGWANFFVIASGAGLWLANTIVAQVPALSQYPLLVVMILLFAAAPMRLLIPNITGYLAITIPIAMSIGTSTGLNSIVCGLLVMIAGDAVLYYPAQSVCSLVVYERGHLTAAEIFRFGLLMTSVAFIVVLVVVIPYWSIVGEPLVQVAAK
jgi:sodium-dependent dicarboxylate transporter 2/3/5